LSATTGDVSRRRGELVQHIVEVRGVLEIVSSAVRQDFRVNDMNLADSPAIEARLGEQVLYQRMIANLDIA
jgi:hypothetical protein